MVVVGAMVAFNGVSVSQGLRELEGLVVDRDEPVGLSGPALAAAEAAPASRGVSARPPGSGAAGATAGGPPRRRGQRGRWRDRTGTSPGGSAGPGGPAAVRSPAVPSRAVRAEARARRRAPAGADRRRRSGGARRKRGRWRWRGQSLGQTTQGVTDGPRQRGRQRGPAAGRHRAWAGRDDRQPGRRPDRWALALQLLEHEAPRQVLHLHVVLERAVVPARDDHQALGLVRGRVQLLADGVGDPLVSTRV